MNRDVWILAVLVSMLLVLNSGIILLVQLNERQSTDYVGSSIGNIVFGADQLKIFDKHVIESTLTKKSTSSSSRDTTTSSRTSKKPKPVDDNPPTPTAQRSALRDVFDDSGRVKLYTINYDTDTITFPDGKTTKIIIDGDINPSQNDYYDKTGSAAASPVTYQQIPYTRFNAFVEQNYYNANQANMIDYLDKLQPRLVLMEQTTGWSSEKFGYGKLDLYIDTTTMGGCYGGYAFPGEAHILFSNPLYQTSCLKPYYENGQQKWNNPGELGDKWVYMNTALHESLHAINPLPIFGDSWLTEGFSEYSMHNTLTSYGDINQETSDTYIFKGNTGYNWTGYISNNYRDTTANNNEIQESAGYDITAWMFTMLRDEWGLRFDRFYYLVNNNLETLAKADETSTIKTDMAVIDIFGRSINRNFNQTKPIFRYDGPSGPGWGVRQWVPITFYGDLRTTMTVSNTNPQPGQQISINATIYNDGQTNLVNIPVRIYYNKDENTKVTLKNQTINLNAGANTVISTTFSSPTVSAYDIIAYADYQNIKLESNEENNVASKQIIFGTLPSGCAWEKIDGYWVQTCNNQATQVK